MTDLTERVARLSPEARAVLERRLREKAPGAAQEFIPRRRRDGPLPLSFAQQRLWFFDQMEPRSPAYNMQHLARIRARLDPAALERSLREIVCRHEALRTRFATVDGSPVQVIAAEQALSLPVVDLTGLASADRAAQSMQLAAEEVRRPFDLGRGPLVRLTLLRLAEEEHLLLVTMHHIVSDGWSMGVFFRELAELYQAFSNGRPSPLPPLPIQYSDFAIWQRELMQGSRLERRLSYWKKQLEDLPVLELVPDHARPGVRTFRGAQLSISLSKDPTDALKALSRHEGATLYMTLLAAFQVLLSRHTGQEDVVVGSPFVERSRVETERLLGLFLNTLTLRTDLTGDPSFRELLGRVRRVALDAFTNEVPFEKLVGALQPERDLSRTPLFQVFFNMLTFRSAEIRMAGVPLEPVDPPEVSSLFDLTLYALEVKDGIRFSAVYNSDLFESGRISEMLEQLIGLLEQAAASPDRRIRSYSLVTASARRLLPDPTAHIEEPKMEVVADDFLSWADRASPAPAVVEQGRVWTYADLAHRSEAIARSLLGQGLVPGDVVGVAGRRSFGLIAGMLGVFRCGGVLLTLDPSLPAARRRLMVLQGRARWMVQAAPSAEEESRKSIPGSLPVLRVDEDGVLVRGDPVAPVASLPRVSSNDPAYIFFTSGTSGAPKAVLGSQKGLSHFLRWQRETFGVGPGDRCAQLIGLSFDAVLRDILLPLTSGSSLHLPDRWEDTGSDRIVSWLEREGITILHTIPSVAQSWLTASPVEARLARLRWAFFTGEPLTGGLVQRWVSAFPQAGRIVNLYGPTETTLVKCFYIVPEDPPAGVQPVGHPLPATQALILAEGPQLCGIGELGEIVLRTPFRSLGYVNATREQQERFVANPFRIDEHDVLYRTGDRGRYRLDGSVAIHGRWDDQVKIRGVRVEPAEVAAALSEHRSVASCVVVPRPDDSRGTTLVAYVVGPRAGPETTAELRRYLSGRLPSAMIPSAFVFLRQLPLTPNGKVDRRALPLPEHSRPETEGDFVAARTPTEEALVGIWSQVLGAERIGVEDDFFALGGHSLLATQVISRIRDVLHVELPLRDLFLSPTIAGLALAVARKQAERMEPAEVERLLCAVESPTNEKSGDEH